MGYFTTYIMRRILFLINKLKFGIYLIFFKLLVKLKLTDGIPEIADLVWKRPAEFPFPKVWHRFTTKSKNGKRFDVRIEDLTDDRMDEVWTLMTEYYFTEEPLGVSSKLPQNPTSMFIYQYLITRLMNEHVSIIAVLDEDVPKPKIVGFQILTVASKSDLPLPEIEDDILLKMEKIYNDIRINCDPFEVFETEMYLHEWGLCVVPEYRGMDIGLNILTSLEYIAKAFNIPGTMIMFTRNFSQAVAERAGFKLYNEIVYDDYRDENGEIIFPIKDTKSLKFMGKSYR